MGILAPIRKYLGNLGVYPSKKFTLRSLFFFISTASYSILSTIFLCFEANTLNEYAESFYGAATPLFVFRINVIHALKREYVFELIELTENFIEKRKVESPAAKLYYEKTSRRIEIWATIFDITINKLTIPGVMLPQFTISYFKYFTTDLGAESFSLPFPTWCVFFSMNIRFEFVNWNRLNIN